MNYHLVFGSTTPLCVGEMRKDWFDTALDVLKNTDNAHLWAVYLKGC